LESLLIDMLADEPPERIGEIIGLTKSDHREQSSERHDTKNHRNVAGRRQVPGAAQSQISETKEKGRHQPSGEPQTIEGKVGGVCSPSARNVGCRRISGDLPGLVGTEIGKCNGKPRSNQDTSDRDEPVWTVPGRLVGRSVV